MQLVLVVFKLASEFTPPCEKLYRDKKCHDLFAAANMQTTRGIGTRKCKSEKLSKCDEREDYSRRSQAALKRAPTLLSGDEQKFTEDDEQQEEVTPFIYIDGHDHPISTESDRRYSFVPPPDHICACD